MCILYRSSRCLNPGSSTSPGGTSILTLFAVSEPQLHIPESSLSVFITLFEDLDDDLPLENPWMVQDRFCERWGDVAGNNEVARMRNGATDRTVEVLRRMMLYLLRLTIFLSLPAGLSLVDCYPDGLSHLAPNLNPALMPDMFQEIECDG
ncbi:hypothetical protein BDQ17DRAFT_1369048 [Cyathus striatus]|nr:hypothetical protein BDQ17DRAFT_1369048 [Cyathus striatus]